VTDPGVPQGRLRRARFAPHPSVSPFDLTAAFRDHHDFVWRSLARLGVHGDAIDDAVQDVFVIAHRRGHNYDGRAPLRHWLYGITRNIALKHRERTARARVRASEGPEVRRIDDPIAERDTIATVERFLAELDEDQRAVFMLAEIEGHTAPEIADMLSVKLNTVYSRLRLARARFERVLERSDPAEVPWTR
jgi:RNA polymerase sigma-70 factor, ECF subfamily